ncbi:copper-translocating P-t [Lentithecium fluviatile CBS 122367]|uniref:Copper-translocating P-t n=1 Tax=Lentithecium fluviatile CBS 122367 TaxID=1168545 RepID=A0A6G1IUM5_9PLEO|nr:copper-translocating P-t [Lentithecium fluviatile CBS 122367]
MACSSGCCGPPKDPVAPPPPRQPQVKETDESFEDNGCNDDGSTKDAVTVEHGVAKSSCCSLTKDRSTVPKEECYAPEKTTPQSVSNCAPISDAKSGCAKRCCSKARAQMEEVPFAAPASAPKTALNIAAPGPNSNSCAKGCCSKKPPSEPVIPQPNDQPSCKKGCCPKPQSTPEFTLEVSVSSDAAKASCQIGCCSKPKIVEVGDGSNWPAPKQANSDCKKGCCTKDDPDVLSSPNANREDVCYPPLLAQKGCQKGCCSKATLPFQNLSDAPFCCVGKPSPCCDESCIERLALLECKSEEPTPRLSVETEVASIKSNTSLKCHRGTDGKPCFEHAQKARRRHLDRLRAIGCICRALVTLGQESCCTTPKETSADRPPALQEASSRRSIDSCCAPGNTTCNAAKESTAQSVASCADSCCEEAESNDAVETIHVFPKGDLNVDLEKGGAAREHVVLSISGMTCTGCETKLKRMLGTLPSVNNLKTSLILARAEFDLDLRLGSADDVLKHLERTTEFKCERVKNEGSSLDLICTTDATDFVKGSWPEGVTDVQLIDKKTIKVDYDAKIVGARDLIKKGWSTPMQLAPLRPDPTLDAGSRHVRHMGWMTILSAVLTIPVLVMAWAPLPEHKIAYGSASLALATIVQVVIAGPFYPKALKDLIFSRTVEMDLLIVLSTSAAYIFSVISFGYMAAGKPLLTGDFFETATLLVTIIMIGRYISALARQKAAESISIRSLQASTAILVEKEGSEREIEARLLQYGDTFKVIPESRIPTDGTVVSGSSEVDESMMTGESIPVVKYPKSTLIAGSINGSGTLTVRLTRLPGDNTISTIASMVDEAKLSKPKIQDIADRVASYFVPVVVALTILTFVIWIAIGMTVRKQSGSDATIQALTYAITVLIVSCPCAIGLAVPMVIVIASGVAAQRGVIFKSADTIEVAYKTTDVVFDKTGTLTQGELSVAHEDYFIEDVEEAKSLLLGLVGSIKHPVSAAITAHLKAANVSAAAVREPKNLPGKGVEGASASCTIRAGNSNWLDSSSHPRVQRVLSQGLTAFCFTVDGTLAAVYGLQDSLRTDALSTISSLQSAGIAVHILSGDDDGAVRSVSAQLNIPDSNVRSRCSPADKQTYIKKLLEPSTLPNQKMRKPTVVFIGDGTNDAPSLSQATIGIHISTGTDVAQSAADVVLMRPNLSGVLIMIAISKKAIRRIAFNFGWSFVYNLFAVLLGAGAFVAAGKKGVDVRIPPEFAGLGELVSVLPVIAAAVALRWTKV